MDHLVIIVGAGPAGIFAALTLADLGIGRVLLLEQGKDLDARQRQCSEDMLCGWGGAGAYSDGKLTFSSEVGGYLAEYLDRDSLMGLLRTADQIYVRFGAPDRLFGELSPAVSVVVTDRGAPAAAAGRLDPETIARVHREFGRPLQRF